MSDSRNLETLLQEGRSFPPSDQFKAQANASDPSIYEQDPFDFWESWAKKLDWFSPYKNICSWRPGDDSFMNARWFQGGTVNAAYNCLDRHVDGKLANKRAIVWEGEPGDQRTLTYRELRDEVARTANALKSLGVKKGDRVVIYMPMVPELPVAMLACARVGAPHCVVFGGFSAESLEERTNDTKGKVIITADGGWRRGSIVPLKNTVDEALEMGCPSVEKVLVVKRTEQGVDMKDARDVWWHDLVPNQSTDCPCEPMDSEDSLYILHTSGSTGKPKGIVHTTGGYLTGVLATTNLVFDIKPDDLFFCTADCGWVTGHSYVVYGPLANAATVMMYEGAPDTPDKDRFWQIVEKHKVTILYTAPTAIRAFMKWGDDYPSRCDLSSLRLLGSVGEPINPEAWIWYHFNIGHGHCPIVDTWWQTETGAIMITALPGITATKPGSATNPFPGTSAAIYDEEGVRIAGGVTQPKPLPPAGGRVHREMAPLAEALQVEGELANRGRGSSGSESLSPQDSAVGGFLVLDRPWPSMTKGIFNDPDRFEKTYWSKFPGVYFPGDGAKVDEEGYFWLLGRVDDVMLVAGHNISTMEVESALVDHPTVAEAAVIGKTHPIKGQSIAAFVILRGGAHFDEGHEEELKAHVAKKIGAIARPDDLYLCAELPKTRSGKIMRRLLRDVAEGRALGDTTTLADPNVVNALKDKYEAGEG